MKIYTLKFRATDKDIFGMIRSGQKKVETRAASIKYAGIKAGDTIVLSCGKEKFSKEVKKSTIFKDTDALLKKYKIKDIMPLLKSKEELEAAYYSFPAYKEKIKKFGIIAFEL